jgi:hypothetical protein
LTSYCPTSSGRWCNKQARAEEVVAAIRCRTNYGRLNPPCFRESALICTVPTR